MGFWSRTWAHIKGGVTTTVLAPAASIGALLPGGAKPSEIPQIWRNAYELGSTGGFLDQAGTTRTWADLGPHIGDGMSNILPATGQVLGSQVHRTVAGAWDGLDVKSLGVDLNLEKVILPAALLLGAILLSRS